MDRLSAMNMFIRVVETGSFSAVAKELSSTQPTVSKNIAELESWLGAKLLNRSTRSLRLTETGADYYERCVAILQDVEDAEQNVGLLQTQPKGLVRVTAAVAFGRLHIVPRLESFFARYPDIKIDITLNDRVVDLIEEGVDIAFRMGNLRDSILIARKLCTSPTAAAASPEYLKKYGVPRHPRDLKEHNYVVYTDLRQPGPDFLQRSWQSTPYQGIRQPADKQFRGTSQRSFTRSWNCPGTTLADRRQSG